jgi:type II secretory pathway pseudopilin PulG
VIRKQNGFSLMEVLVASALGMMVMLGMASYLMQQKKEVVRLRQKVDIGELADVIRRTYSEALTCSETLAKLEINENQMKSKGYSLSAKIVRETSDENYPPLIQVGQRVPNLNPEVMVDRISYMNWRKLGNDHFRFDVQVDLSSQLGPISPIKVFGVTLYTEPASPATQKVVVGCGDAPTSGPLSGPGSSQAPISAAGNCRTVISKGNMMDGKDSVNCKDGEKVHSGGGECVTVPSLQDEGKTMSAEMISTKPTDSRPTTNGWEITCSSGGAGSIAAAYAVCCKKD